MPTRDSYLLHLLLDSIDDTHEIVVRRSDAEDMIRAAWEAARDDAHAEWTAWTARPGTERWAVYLAACDREDAALAALGVGR